MTSFSGCVWQINANGELKNLWTLSAVPEVINCNVYFGDIWAEGPCLTINQINRFLHRNTRRGNCLVVLEQDFWEIRALSRTLLSLVRVNTVVGNVPFTVYLLEAVIAVRGSVFDMSN